MVRDEALISQLTDPNLRAIYYAYRLLQKIGGNGSIEVHFVSGSIREKNGLFLKPGINHQVIDIMRELVET